MLTALASLLLTFPQNTEATTKTRAAVADTVNSVSAPALLIAIARKGKVVLAEAHGRNDQNVTLTSLFPMGQSSRVVTNLLLAKLAKTRTLDLSKPISKLTDQWTLRNARGEASEASLLQVLQGKPGLPHHHNFFDLATARSWPAGRAIREHAVAGAGTGTSSLSYGVVQMVLEGAMKKTWAEIIRTHLATPWKLPHLVTDARLGLPTTAVSLYRPGSLFRKRTEETRFVPTLPAAQGAWIDPKGFGILLRELLRAAGGRIDVVTPSKIDPVFTSFRRRWQPHDHATLDVGAPGVRGGIAIYPQHDIAWAVLINANENSRGIPKSLQFALEQAWLPKPEAEVDKNRWNTTAKVGGKPPPFEKWIPGAWKGAITLGGKKLDLRVWCGDRRPTHVQCGNRPKIATQGWHHPTHKGPRFGLTTEENLLAIRADLDDACYRIRLAPAEKGVLRGEVELDGGRYCRMTFPITLRKVGK